MNSKRVVAGIISTSLRMIILAFVVIFVYKTSMTAYDFGFRIFSEKPQTVGEGQDIEVTVPIGKSTMEIGEILKDKGLISDAKLFYFQELLSAYHGELQPGVYTLNTSMSSTDMMKEMAKQEETEEEEQ